MKIRRGQKGCGVRNLVLRKVRGLELRCEWLEREVNALALTDRLAQAFRRISELEERLKSKSKAA